MVKQMGGLDATQDFAQLLMFPDIYHRGGGYGPSHFDMVAAITAWVEHGIAPDKIMTTQYNNDFEQQAGALTGENEVNTNTILPNISRSNETQTEIKPWEKTRVMIIFFLLMVTLTAYRKQLFLHFQPIHIL
jgi:hypothetical protein